MKPSSFLNKSYLFSPSHYRARIILVLSSRDHITSGYTMAKRTRTKVLDDKISKMESWLEGLESRVETSHKLSENMGIHLEALETKLDKTLQLLTDITTPKPTTPTEQQSPRVVLPPSVQPGFSCMSNPYHS